MVVAEFWGGISIFFGGGGKFPPEMPRINTGATFIVSLETTVYRIHTTSTDVRVVERRTLHTQTHHVHRLTTKITLRHRNLTGN